jgi:hypothetical protein
MWAVLAWVILLMTSLVGSGGFIAAVAGLVLLATVFAAVYHAEVVAHRVGEPFGTLVLALAVTVIETALIVSVMIAAPAESTGLARDTVFAAVMIVCNGIVGPCLLMGGARYHEQGFQVQGASAALAVLAALTGLTLILPNYAASELGPLYSAPQLVFAGLVSLVLYGSFVFIQTVRHRDYFLPVQTADEDAHAPPPNDRTTVLSAGLLLISLVAIVGLAKILTPTVEFGVTYFGVPKAVVGIIIVTARKSGGPQGSPGQSITNQLESRVGIIARDHWLDDPGGCRCFDRAFPASRTRPGRERSSPAGADAAPQRDHLGHRPDHGASGHRTFGSFRRFFVFCGCAVKCEGLSAQPGSERTSEMAHRCGSKVSDLRQLPGRSGSTRL